MKKRLTALLLAAALAFSLAACGAGESAAPEQSETAPAEAPAPTAEPAQTAPAAAARPTFLAEQPVLYDTALTPAVPAYEVAADFSNVINADEQLSYWNEEAKQKLLQNGFVVVTGYGGEFFDSYEMNRYDLTPNFVTTDSLLHTYHLYFAYLLKNCEKGSLYEALCALTDAMLRESAAQYDTLQGTGWETAALRNTAYFAVAARLLQCGGRDGLPAQAETLADQEEALIGQAAGVAASPLLSFGAASPCQEDYSQYTPRGYYAADETLSRYFRAMMWYGRLNFLQSEEDHERSALLMVRALETSGAQAQWENIYDVTSFFAGTSDDAGCYEYAELAQAAYGADVPVDALPGDAEGWAQFRALTAALEPPAVNSIPIFEWDDTEEKTKGFRFMGQRFTLDAAVFQNLVYRAVEENPAGERRMLPSALDLPAAMGSDTALAILTETGAAEYKNYPEAMQTLREGFDAADEQTLYTASLYNGWLNMLRPLLAEKGEGYPMFMRNTAWTTKNLATFLGSWTELKHDTVLYAKQSYAEMGGGGVEEKDDRGYVEPEPVVFGRLSALAQATADGLAARGMLQDTDAENLGLLAELSARLMTIAEKELKNELPTDEEFDLIRGYGGQLEHFWYEVNKEDADSAGMDWFSSQNFPAALVTDVATDPNGSVLEVGTNVNYIYVIVPVDGVLRLAQGSVFAFYEFAQPIDQRLTDKQWQRMLGIDPFDDEGNYLVNDETERPAHPAWTGVYRIDDVYGG